MAQPLAFFFFALSQAMAGQTPFAKKENSPHFFELFSIDLIHRP